MIKVELEHRIGDRESIKRIEGEFQEVLAMMSEMGYLKANTEDEE